MSTIKTIAIIPARGGSKRLPRKNTLMLGGIPLIAHSILYARANSDIIDEIYVSTNDPAIKEVALEYGALVIDRPEELAGDHEPTISALQHVVQNCGHTSINVVLLQPTNPLRPDDLLKNCFKRYIEEKRDSLFTVTRSEHKLGKIGNGIFVPFNYVPGQRSQDLEPLYFENGLLYISRASTILSGKIISQDAMPYIVDHPFADVDIDTEDDLDYASYLLASAQNRNV
ncbi:MAG TPA: acylneuraminate cytidylyltransferase family protein [Flavobacterium sp.]|jgi:N-acylneuraminate cytidylyltransferase